MLHQLFIMNKTTRICIIKTEGEWRKIDEIINKNYDGKADYYSYIQGSLFELKKRFEECSECITSAGGARIIRTSSIHPNILPILDIVSEKMNCSKNSIIEQFFIQPLINNPLVNHPTAKDRWASKEQ